MRDSFIFYRSFYEALKDLSIKDRAILFEAICEFSLNGKEIELQKTSKTVFKLIQPILNANNKKYESGLKGAEFGKLGGRPKKTETPLKPQDNPIETPNKDKDKDKDVYENVQTYGNDKSQWFIIKPKYVTDTAIRVNKDGLNEYLDKHQWGFRFKKPYLEERLWKEWGQKAFKDSDYFNSVAVNLNNDKEWITK